MLSNLRETRDAGGVAGLDSSEEPAALRVEVGAGGVGVLPRPGADM